MRGEYWRGGGGEKVIVLDKELNCQAHGGFYHNQGSVQGDGELKHISGINIPPNNVGFSYLGWTKIHIDK